MSERRERKNRSEKYQFLLLETACSAEMMEAFSNSESIEHRLNPFKYDEEIEELYDQLKEAFWNIVDNNLTTRQKQVIKLYCQNKTQTEIAKELGVNQSSITKSINGNVDYKNGRRCYGGATRKVVKLVESDENIKRILKRIMELKEEKI
jgi:DNA-directed RNA polymerase specialized sigma subunit